MIPQEERLTALFFLFMFLAVYVRKALVEFF
jgi:hypothetical protein